MSKAGCVYGEIWRFLISITAILWMGFPLPLDRQTWGGKKQQIDLAHPYYKKVSFALSITIIWSCRGEEEFKLYQDFKILFPIDASGMLK